MAIALIGSAIAGGVASNGTVTTTGFDSTGTNLLVVGISSYTANTPLVSQVLSDSFSNTWIGLTPQENTDQGTKLFYCVPPSNKVGASHTFTFAGTAIYPSVCALAFSGGHATPLDQQNGGGAASGVSSQPGTITPSENNCVVVTSVNAYIGTSLSINGGFTASAINWNGGNNRALGVAYLIQTTAAAANPTWSWTTDGYNATAIASFKAAAASGVISPNPKPHQLINAYY